MRTLPRWGVVAAVSVVLAAGCTSSADPEPPQPSPEPTEEPTDEQEATPEPTDEPEPEPEAAVTVVRELQGYEVEIGVHALEVEGDFGLLVVDYRVVGDGDDVSTPVSNSMLAGGRVGYSGQAGGLRLVDIEAREVLPTVIEDNSIFASLSSHEEGQRSVSLHPAPSSSQVDVLIPALGYVADVPVVEADELFDEMTAELALPAEPAPVFPLTARSLSRDEAAEVEEEGEEITVTLTSDVLFGPDEHELGSAASGALDRAVAEIERSSDGGEVQVIGHTDNVPTDAYADNQELSERRAASVGDELGSRLGDDYQVRTEGRGDTEPRASNDSAEGRAQNRRVEIRFEGRRILAAEDGEVNDDELDLPEASGYDPVEFGGWQVSAHSVIERGEFLVGTIRIEQLDEAPEVRFPNTYRSEGGDEGHRREWRNYNTLASGAGAAQVALRTEEDWVMPIDYAVSGEDDDADERLVRNLLGEESRVPDPDGVGAVRLVTVVWAGTGQDAVDIEAWARFRLHDVPVSESFDEVDGN